MKDIEILRWAHEFENLNPNISKLLRHWERPPGSTAADMRRLLDGGFVELTTKASNHSWYKLTKQGEDSLFNQNMEREISKVPVDSIQDAMSMIIGFDDIKKRFSDVIHDQERVHFLLVGPPACAKSLFLEANRAAVPNALIVFGSQTSASGLSDQLFAQHPSFLLADELDKMRYDAYSIMLALLERGEILVTKSQNTRGIQLETTVFAACNSDEKMPRELISRFITLYFNRYTREEFIQVCTGFLSRSRHCPPELAEYIGSQIYDYELGDIRLVQKIYDLIKKNATLEEAESTINFIRKYGPQNCYIVAKKTRIQTGSRLPGM